MVLCILFGYWVLGVVYLDQLSGARHVHISYHDKNLKKTSFKVIIWKGMAYGYNCLSIRCLKKVTSKNKIEHSLKNIWCFKNIQVVNNN